MSNKSDLKKLQSFWYAKLKDSGFDDIEQDENRLKVWSSDFRLDKSTKLAQSKEEYYYMATSFLNDYNFENALEKAIWTYHAEAISVRDIAKLLSKLKVIKTKNHTSIFNIIKKLEIIMKSMYLSGYQKEYE